MPVELTDNIAPSGDSGGTPATFSTHLDTYGNGGYRAVADQSERLGNSGVLTELRRKLGMAVYQQDTNKLYILTNNPATPTTTVSDWTEFSGSGGILSLQDVMDNGSVGDVTTNIDLITQDAAVSSGRFCRMRTFLSGTTTRTLVQSQGLVGDSDSEVIITASDSAPTGEKSSILLSGMTGDITISGTGMGTPNVGDVLTAADVNGQLTWTPQFVGLNMQSVFDNSIPNITAVDTTKDLSLSAAEAKILTSDSSGGTSEIVLQANNSVTSTVNELKIDGGANLTTLTTNNLDVEVRSSNSSSSPEVGDVLMINQLVNSTYGRLKYKPGVQIKRVGVGVSQLQNLFTTPVSLITGIGGRYIMILEAYVGLAVDPVAPVGYNAGVILEIENTTFGIPILRTNEFMQSTAQGTRTFYPIDPATIGPNDRPVGSSAGWRLSCTADLGTSGNSTLDIFIAYIVIP